MSTLVRRYDVGSISSAQRTPQGYLRAPGFATRVGVFKYRKPDGTIRAELRPPESVFDQDSLNTLSGIPLTNTHPTKLLDPKNTKDHSVGFTGDDVSVDGHLVKVPVTITDEKTIKEVESGAKQELSCGYTCDLVSEPGIFEGEPYDCIQRNIVYNHLAIVGKGRAGAQARIHLDSADAVMVTQDPKEDKMEKVDIGGKTHEVHPELAAALKEHMGKKDEEMANMKKSHEDAMKMMDSMKKDNEAMKNQLSSYSKGKETSEEDSKEKAAAREKELATVEAKKDALEEEVKGLKTQLAPENISKLVAERAKLESAARAVGIKKFDVSDVELKKAVITAKSKTDLTGKSEAYIDARFDAVCESLSGSAVSALQAALLPDTRPGKTKMDSEETRDPSEVRKARMDEDTKLWQKPSGKTKAEVIARRTRQN